ncbi:MAG: GAF domain-containing protein [Crocinitomix sp.]|nr:GAF domain-containing protein [Crocinitomix sp.]
MTIDQPINWRSQKHSPLSDEIKTDLVNAFATAIAEQKSVYDLVWKVVEKVNVLLSYEDCVLYLYDEDKECLIQMAAYGAKKVNQKSILAAIRIEPGEGIVGGVYLSGTSRIIGDTTLDGNYIVDDSLRLSEISIPIISNGDVIGVLDSEHPSENYYTDNDRIVLEEVTALIAAKLAEF